MNQKTRKILAALLTLVMLAAVALVPTAIAAQPKNPYGIESIVALGDSIAQGKNNQTPGSAGMFGNFDVGFNSLLAADLGLLDTGAVADTYTRDDTGETGYVYSPKTQSAYFPWTAVGMRTWDVLYQLDEKYLPEDKDTDKVIEHWLTERYDDMDKHREVFRSQIANADLIVVNVGSNDCLTSPFFGLMWDVGEQYGLKDSDDIKATLLSVIGVGTRPSKVTEETAKAMAQEFLKQVVPTVLKSYARFQKAYPTLLKELRALNPTAQIICNGTSNPLGSQTISIGDKELSIGALFNGLTLTSGSVIASAAARYGCTFVDMTTIPLDSDVHPTIDGYREMANRIEKKLTPVTDYKDVKLLSKENQKAVLWGTTTGAFLGTTKTKFNPAGFVTYKQFAEALDTLAGGNANVYGSTDNRILPRRQLISLLYQFAQEQGDPSVEGYTDAFKWAAATGITKGLTTLQMKSITPVSRAQAVLFLYRYATNVWAPEAASSADVTVSAELANAVG